MLPKPMKSLLVLGLLLTGLWGGAGAGVAPAPDVGEQLPSTTGEDISLSQFRGKKFVLLEFYGVDFAPV